MDNERSPLSQHHTFLVRIWWEEGLTWPDGRPLWRGQVQCGAGGRLFAFQSLDGLLRFIQQQTGKLENADEEAPAQTFPEGQPT